MVSLSLGVAHELYTIVIDVKFGLRVGLMCPYESRVDKLLADVRGPYRRAQLVGIRIGAHYALVVVKNFVAYVPFAYTSLVLSNHSEDMVFQYVEQFSSAKVVVVLLSVFAHPFGHLLMPCQCVPAHLLIESVGHPHHSIRTAEVEFTAIRFCSVKFHLVFAYKHVKLAPGYSRFAVVAAAVVPVCAQCQTYVLAQFRRIFAQRRIVGNVGSPVVVGVFAFSARFILVVTGVSLSAVVERCHFGHDAVLSVVALMLLHNPCISLGITYSESPSAAFLLRCREQRYLFVHSRCRTVCQFDGQPRGLVRVLKVLRLVAVCHYAFDVCHVMLVSGLNPAYDVGFWMQSYVDTGCRRIVCKVKCAWLFASRSYRAIYLCACRHVTVARKRGAVEYEYRSVFACSTVFLLLLRLIRIVVDVQSAFCQTYSSADVVVVAAYGVCAGSFLYQSHRVACSRCVYPAGQNGISAF